MLIILEGVDGAGKSTLASAIVEKIQKLHPEDTVEYLHASQIKGTVYEEYVEPLNDYSPGSGRHIVIDRWHVGERIYGPLYRDSSAFDAATGSFAWIELFLASKGARLWNVTQELDVLQKRLADRGEDFLEDRHVEYVRDRFIEETKASMLFAGSASPSDEWTATYARVIVEDAEFADFRSESLQAHKVKFYLGQTYVDPTTVLIVDNKYKNFMYHPDNSDEAAILLSSLRHDVIGGLAIVQSVSQSALQELVERLSMSGIVTYSETVSARLTAAGINHIKFDEPVKDRGYPVKFYLAAEKAQDLD